jgi:hypothetical protein
MKTPFWKTYAALVVLAGLGAYAYFIESKHAPASETPEPKAREKVFRAIEREKIEELTIAPEKGEAMRLVKQGRAWALTLPQAAPAATSEVDSLLGSLVSLEASATANENPTNLADYGLATPRLTVGFRVAGASQALSLALGSDVPGRDQTFAKLTTSPRVFTIASYLRGTFEKKPFDLRDRALLHLQRDAVTSLEVVGPEGSYTAAKGEQDAWAFTQPLATAADRWSVDRLLGSLESLRMESIAAEAAKDLKPFGLVKPTRVVTLGLKDGNKKVLEIGSAAPEGKLYAREAGSTLVAIIPSRLGDDLKKGMADLRAKRLLDVSAYDVEGFDLDAGGVKKTYARSTSKDKEGIEGYKWKRTAPDAHDLDTNRVQDALFKIGGVEAAEFVDQPQPPAAYGLDQPALRITLRLAKSNATPARSTWLEMGQKSGVSYARRPNDAAVLRVDSAKADELLKAFAGL